MESVIVDLALIGLGVIAALIAVNSSIASADGGPDPEWAWPTFLAGIILAILGGGLLSAKIIALIVRLWP